MPKINLGKMILDFLEMTFIGVAVVLLVYVFVCQLLKVTGNSMFPTFKDNEQILAEKVSLKMDTPRRGEIVVFKHPLNQNRLLIKRVIGLPNDVITVTNGQVFINQEPLDETYLEQGTVVRGGRIIGEGVSFKIPENSYVLMGDNREESSDSRDFGPVNKDLIVGKALFVYYPLNSIRFISGN